MFRVLMSALTDATSCNRFITTYQGWDSTITKDWNDQEIAKVILALRERLVGTQEYSTFGGQAILERKDHTFTMNTNEDNVKVIAIAHFKIKDFKLTELSIGENEIILENPNQLASTMFLSKVKNCSQSGFEEIRSGVRLAVSEACKGSKDLEIRSRCLCRRLDGSYTLNIYEENLTALGFIHYEIKDFEISRIVIGGGFETAPEIRAAFEGYDL